MAMAAAAGLAVLAWAGLSSGVGAQLGGLLAGAAPTGFLLLRDKTDGRQAVMPRLCTFYPDTGHSPPSSSSIIIIMKSGVAGAGRCMFQPAGYRMLVRYFYNTTLDACQPFWYSQCGGNQNRFLDGRQCYSFCTPKYVDQML